MLQAGRVGSRLIVLLQSVNPQDSEGCSAWSRLILLLHVRCCESLVQCLVTANCIVADCESLGQERLNMPGYGYFSTAACKSTRQRLLDMLENN